MGLFSVASLLVLVAMANASESSKPRHYDVSNAHAIFEQFVKDHSKEYKDDADRAAHFRAFVSNLEKINKLNEENPSATYGLNKFADYTEDERQNMFGFKKD